MKKPSADEKYICIHGHFYQPPRDNPWLNEVELQDSAYPYHDWNERITAECYARNAASRVQDNQGRIIEIINNYEHISFNFGPTLLEWMAEHAPETYEAILEADRRSLNRFSGHGSAIAQVYNHMIMPLANERDRETQVIWGIRDFEFRFGRKPEGMWLAETAVDTPSLETLAAHGIKFTILSPYQALRYRKIGQEDWKDGTGAKIDPRRPYRCKLPSGRHIDLFFYDGPVSQGIAFEGLLNSGEAFANRLVGQLDHSVEEPQIMHIATDGETYGHHHKLGEMALSYCLRHIEEEKPAKITIYGEYLEKFPPTYEAEIIEESSWSCAHGVERWRSNCGCNTGGNLGWAQEWRGPLRDALDYLRAELITIYEEHLQAFTPDPWKLRNQYIQVILNRSEENIEDFFSENIQRPLNQGEKVKLLKLLEMQYHTMLMYTSCGWFFDELTGIETIQDIFYAARALQLAEEISGRKLEEEFLKKLEKAESNLPSYENGANAYKREVQPAILDLTRVGAHYAISSLFTHYKEVQPLYSYMARSELYNFQEAGREKIGIGRALLKSRITWEEERIAFAILHLGDHHMFGGVRRFQDQENFMAMEEEFTSAFEKTNVFDIIMLIDKHFGSHNYSFWHLFKDDQKKVLNQVLEQNAHDIEREFRKVYENNYSLIQAMNQLDQSLPLSLRTTVSFVINASFRRLLEEPELDLPDFKNLVEEFKRVKSSTELDTITLNFIATDRITEMMQQLRENPQNEVLFLRLIETLTLLKEAGLEPDLWKAQNYCYQLKREIQPDLVLAGTTEEVEQQTPATKIKYKELFETLNIKA